MRTRTPSPISCPVVGEVEELVAGGGGSRRAWVVDARGQGRRWTGASGGRSRGEDGVGEEEDDVRPSRDNAILVVELQGWPDCALPI